MNLSNPSNAFDQPNTAGATSDDLDYIPLALHTNPFWAILRGWFKHQDPAYAPTLWNRGPDGTFSPSINPATGQPFPVSAAVQSMLNQYNDQNSRLNQANRNAIDAVLNRFMPISDVLYRELTDFSVSQLISDASWLGDHQQGSDFYNNPNNYVGLPYSDFDQNGDFVLARFNQLLAQSCLAVDHSEVDAKVNAGVSTPIVIDLNGDGVETTSFLAGPTVYFDIDGDGIKDRTAWLSGKDAFLAIDKNGNGKIDGLEELFGGPNRADGFARLNELDGNGDGVVDAADSRFSELLLWQDRNIDGLTDAGELVSASAAGLQSISTNYATQEVIDHGNILGEVSAAIFQGQETSAVDVYFRYSAGQQPDSIQANAKADSLVSAMAAFSAPSAGGIAQPPFADERKSMELAATSHYF